MSLLAVTVLGHDRPGIIAAVTAALAESGGNLEDSSMTLLRGHFAMTLVVRCGESAEAVRERVDAALAADDLVVSVLDLPAEPAASQTGSAYLLTVHGGDRPGIVSAVAGLVAEHSGNVIDLTTRLAGNLYVVVAEVDLPATVDVTELGDRLAELAGRLGVEASLRPTDPDIL